MNRHGDEDRRPLPTDDSTRDAIRRALARVARCGEGMMPKDITGRDSYIVTKALAYAIEAIKLLPAERREESDLADMKRLFEEAVQDDGRLAHIVGQVRAQLTGDGWEVRQPPMQPWQREA